jgi:hypothetical protein
MPALVEDVLPWMAAFFIFDALVSLRRGQVMFSRFAGGPFRLLRTGLQLVGGSPLGAAVTAYELPFLPTREGLWTFDPAARAAPPVIEPWALTFVPWTALTGLRGEGTAVKGAGRVLFRARTAADAQALAAGLVRLRNLPEAEREDALERRLETGFDLETVQARWKRLRLPAGVAAAFGTLEALVLFGALPALLFWTGVETWHWEAAFAALGLTHLGAVAAAAWTLKRSGAGSQLMASTLISLAVFPPYAARAGIHVLRDAFVDREPLALAAVLLPRGDFHRLARYELVRTAESLEATRELGLEGMWRARQRALERLLLAAGTSAAQVLASPAPVPGVAALCRMCLGEYRAGFNSCSDCGIPLASSEGTGAEALPAVVGEVELPPLGA